MEALVWNTETSVLTRATVRNIPEDGILHCHHRGNLRSYSIHRLSLSLKRRFRDRILSPSSGRNRLLGPLDMHRAPICYEEL
jgi:hypothetical protein